MLKPICSFLLFKIMGWKANVTEPLGKKYIIALAPHTSNMDFIVGLLYSRAVGMRSNFLMKKEWFFWPLGPIMRHLGGIPVQRNKKSSMTDQLAEVALRENIFHLTITPEGTRKRTEEWKKGFYYIALKAKLPILLFGLDYKRKLIECTHSLFPTGNLEKDMAAIKLYFKDFIGKYPEKFTVGSI